MGQARQKDDFEKLEAKQDREMDLEALTDSDTDSVESDREDQLPVAGSSSPLLSKPKIKPVVEVVAARLRRIDGDRDREGTGGGEGVKTAAGLSVLNICVGHLPIRWSEPERNSVEERGKVGLELCRSGGIRGCFVGKGGLFGWVGEAEVPSSSTILPRGGGVIGDYFLRVFHLSLMSAGPDREGL